MAYLFEDKTQLIIKIFYTLGYGFLKKVYEIVMLRTLMTLIEQD